MTRTRKFEKHKSVFKDFRDDTPELIEECLEHDFLLWKLEKFEKDPEERLKVIEIMKENGDILKNLFVVCACNSHFPQVGKEDFLLNIKEKFGNVIDKKFTSGMVGVSMIAALGGPVKFESKLRVEKIYMTRYEFFETIVRVAQGKYRDDHSTSEALVLVLEEIF